MDAVFDKDGNGGDGSRACMASCSDGIVAGGSSSNMNEDCRKGGDSSVFLGGENECVPISSDYSVAIGCQSAGSGVKSVATSNGRK